METEPDPSPSDDTARRRDEALARLLKMSPKPHEDIKLGKPRRRTAAKQARQEKHESNIVPD
jgi:hypothetical protein